MPQLESDVLFGSFGTADLPDEVVTQDVCMGLWMLGTDVEQPRKGEHIMSWSIGDRENPDPLTPDEARYLIRILERGIKKLEHYYLGESVMPMFEKPTIQHPLWDKDS